MYARTSATADRRGAITGSTVDAIFRAISYRLRKRSAAEWTFDHLRELTIANLEVNAPSAVVMIYFAGPAAVRMSPKLQTPSLDAAQNGVEGRLVYQEGVVQRLDRLPIVGQAAGMSRRGLASRMGLRRGEVRTVCSPGSKLAMTG